jgi:hypothetical protein
MGWGRQGERWNNEKGDCRGVGNGGDGWGVLRLQYASGCPARDLTGREEDVEGGGRGDEEEEKEGREMAPHCPPWPWLYHCPGLG